MFRKNILTGTIEFRILEKNIYEGSIKLSQQSFIFFSLIKNLKIPKMIFKQNEGVKINGESRRKILAKHIGKG